MMVIMHAYASAITDLLQVLLIGQGQPREDAVEALNFLCLRHGNLLPLESSHRGEEMAVTGNTVAVLRVSTCNRVPHSACSSGHHHRPHSVCFKSIQADSSANLACSPAACKPAPAPVPQTRTGASPCLCKTHTVRSPRSSSSSLMTSLLCNVVIAAATVQPCLAVAPDAATVIAKMQAAVSEQSGQPLSESRGPNLRHSSNCCDGRKTSPMIVVQSPSDMLTRSHCPAPSVTGSAT